MKWKRDEQTIGDPKRREHMSHSIRRGDFIGSASNEINDVCMPNGHVDGCCRWPVLPGEGAVIRMCVVDLQQRQNTGLSTRYGPVLSVEQ